MHKVQSVLKEFKSWADGCVCHPEIAKLGKYGSRARAFLKTVRVTHGHRICPMGGKRAVELASDAVDLLLERLCATAASELLLEIASTLGVEQQESNT